ncbi:MAG: lipoprotein [Gammaproteobacteria bacterium]|nr:lipoprotein [Gammaproteobacteria bacterium]
MVRRLIALGGAFALLFLLGCGNKGSLYLPDHGQAPQQDDTASRQD